MNSGESEAGSLADRLLADELLSRTGGEVDIAFYAMRFHVDKAAIEAALITLVGRGYLRVEDRWTCSECGEPEGSDREVCSVCGYARTPSTRVSRVFVRPVAERGRDPAAAFLIHGMNTLGEWQQSFAWQFQLLYGYSLPVFVFKYGRDLTSPWTRFAQLKRVQQLGNALRGAQEDLAGAGRTGRCDVIAHSFGTLLISEVLASPEFGDLNFGRVILSGSIVVRDYPWTQLVVDGRVQGVLNHRAGRDVWVRLAPWFFPSVGASGVDGFEDIGVQDLQSPEFRHSDHFKLENFDLVIKRHWKAFLESPEPMSANPVIAGPNARRRGVGRSSRFWIGRTASIIIAGGLLTAIVRLASSIC